MKGGRSSAASFGSSRSVRRSGSRLHLSPLSIPWFQVQVSTADSVQGRENSCTIFDIVLAYAHIGGWGSVKEEPKLNVALSRSCDHFVLVCDPSALDPSERHQQQLDGLEPEERQERERAERGLGNHLRGLFQHFKKKGMVYLEKAEALPEISLIDMTAVNEFRRRNVCRNCQELGHKSEVHPNLSCVVNNVPQL